MKRDALVAALAASSVALCPSVHLSLDPIISTAEAPKPTPIDVSKYDYTVTNVCVFAGLGLEILVYTT
jgi:hypothetical protein